MWLTSTETHGESRTAIRFALGVTIASALSAFLDAPVPALFPLVVATLLKPGMRPLPLKVVAIVLVTTFVLFTVGQMVTHSLLVFPGALVLLSTLWLYLCYYANAGGANPAVVTLALFAVLLLPVMGVASLDVAQALSTARVPVMATAFACSYFAFALVPYREGDVDLPETAASQATSEGRKHRVGLTSTVIAAPVFFAYLAFGSPEYTTGLIFMGLLLLNPDVTSGGAQSRSWILANLAGGAVALVVATLSEVIATEAFAVLLVFITALFFGRYMATQVRPRSTAASAFNAVLLVATAPNAVSKLELRLLQIAAAIVYVALVSTALSPTRRIAS